MTVKTYLWGISASTILCFAAWAAVLQNVDPVQDNPAGFIAFYLTLFLALASLFSLAGFYLRRKIFESKIEFRQAEVSFRQGILLAVTSVGLLILQGERRLDLYSAFLFVFLVVAAEFYFLIKK